MYFYFTVFIATLILTIGLTYLVMKLAVKLKIVDRPDGERKNHGRVVPLLGGLAIFAAFFIVLYFLRGHLLAGNLKVGQWLGFFVGGALLMIGGWLDDKFNLKPGQQVIWPVLAVVAVILGGVSIEKITNPFGGYLYLGALSAALIAFWLLGMMYTTKLLDGLDGLVSGLTAIGSIIIFIFTLSQKYYQPDVGLAALILAAACLGFLFFNWHPAKIFLGEGGSLFLGYALGTLAVISGGKIAIALLVMGLPVLDVVWTIVRRLSAGRNPFKFADRLHLHFRLLNLGLSVKQAVLLFYAVAFIFGLLALYLQSAGKLLALGILALIMILIIGVFAYLDKKSKTV